MKFNIFRYDPDKDDKPREVEYELELDPTDRMLLDALVPQTLRGCTLR